MSSYVPRLLPRARTEHECLLQSDGTDLKLAIGPTTVARDISVCRAQIGFRRVQDGRSSETHDLYQPLGAHYLKIPKLRSPKTSPRTASVIAKGPAEKRLGNTRYGLGATSTFQAWFADSTVKLTPRTPCPTGVRDTIRISTAANESQSFQLVLSPKTDFEFRDIRVSPWPVVTTGWLRPTSSFTSSICEGHQESPNQPGVVLRFDW
ncbi:MAG: hypothetical protein Ct9H300mP1_38170 [Planctomycetaceae bacterium]|nr:MAG: hypothetical protein Ct9H300mP1_38170 [Planctomycetaceae bacterium]